MITTYSLAHFSDGAVAHTMLGMLVEDASRAVMVTAFETLPDAQHGIAAVTAPGFWLLHADPDGDAVLTLPPGIVAISPLFAGMAEPILAPP